jgi:hypothetical protein
MIHGEDTPEEVLIGVRKGHRPFKDLLACFPDRTSALAFYAERVSGVHSPGAVAGDCEVCCCRAAKAQVTFQWRARIALEFRKDFLKAMLLVPPVMLFLILGVNLVPNVPGSGRYVSFTTAHNVCTSCRRRLRIRYVLGAVVQYLLLLVCAPCLFAAAILGTLIVAALFRAFGLTPQDAEAMLPWWFLSLSLLVFLGAIRARAQDKVLLVEPILEIARGPFHVRPGYEDDIVEDGRRDEGVSRRPARR